MSGCAVLTLAVCDAPSSVASTQSIEITEQIQSNISEYDLFNRALRKYEQGDYKGAIADFDQAIALNPQNVMAYIHRGFTYDDMKEYSKAIADFDRAIALNPELPAAYGGRSATYFSLDNTSQAKQDLETAAKLLKEQGEQAKYQAMLDILDYL
ncbi:tetratricopeptide repeat protein [Acaryochloris marina]|uniref:TPR domain protein n=1 Tax=Acaryochloris marina (strain MBIC 11017) TaxID=329726 RepID=A8ZR33_ACAM1|nr:TPR domain protein [Acaryochloris marina MBIC11017]